MGFDENISMNASKKYPKNINKAINAIIKDKKDDNHNNHVNDQQNQHQIKNIINIKEMT